MHTLHTVSCAFAMLGVKMERSQEVEFVIESKFDSISQSSKPIPWVNMGKSEHKIFIGGEHFTTTTAIVTNFLKQFGSENKLLDLGTANGDLLIHIQKNHGVPWSQLMGVSAVDHRASSSTIPDSSYRLLNIDQLDKHLVSLGCCSYGVIFSFATFYHLVDPWYALKAVFKLLAPGGLAVIAHLPLEGCTQSADQNSYLSWNTQLADSGQGLVLLRMLDSPGNYLAVMRRTEDENLLLPLSYTGDIVSVSSTYTYAMVTWLHTNQDNMSNKSGSEHWISTVKSMLEVPLQNL